jgi:lysophospholipase L1-like esterase
MKVVPIDILGFPGATFNQVLGKMPEQTNRESVILFCAGENDLGNGLSVEDTLEAMDRLLAHDYNHLVLLGPKLEPWLEDDPLSRKHYVKLSKGLRRRCEGHENVTYLDCLTLFCGESANQPGALLGGKAKADPKYFDADKLHLSEEGYQLWKQVIEDVLTKLM